MAGLINRFGTQPTAAAPRRRGGGGGNGVQPNRGGGGGGGGGGRNRLPNTGLYQGRAGEAQANQNPEAFLRSAVSGVGGLNYSGTPIGDFSERFVQKLLDEYNLAVSGNQRLSVPDWMRQTYGAGWEGKKGRTFNPGQLGSNGGALDAAFTENYSNEDPLNYLTGQAAKQGGFAAGGGNQDFQRWYQENQVPALMAELAGAQATDPNISMANLIAGRDLVGQARRRYLARPDTQRAPGPINLGSRWSWWE